MKTLFIILLIFGSMNAHGVIIDKFECTTEIHNVENETTNLSITSFNILRRQKFSDDSHIPKPIPGATWAFGSSSSKMTVGKEWNVGVGLTLTYSHRIVTSRNTDLGQQQLCLKASLDYCISGFCSIIRSVCFDKNWTDVEIDEQTETPIFEDRLLRTVSGNFDHAGENLPEVNYEISCKFKGTEQHQ